MAEINLLDDKPATTPTTPATQPFGFKERMITQFIFDTQPKKKEAYLKQLGYEMNPKDENEFRPIGSTDEYGKIDPGGYFNLKQYRNAGKRDSLGKAIGVDNELTNDLVEMGLDMLLGSAVEAGGVAGAAGGSLTGTPAGMVLGRSTGRAFTFNALEKIKDGLGDMIVTEKVPVDDVLRIAQTAIQSVAPEVMSKGLEKSVSLTGKAFSSISDGVRKLLAFGDGKIAPQAWDALKVNPKLLDGNDVLMTASQRLDDTADRLMGTTATNKKANLNASVLGEKLQSLEPLRQLEAKKLGLEGGASYRAGDIQQTLLSEVAALQNKKTIPTYDGKNVIQTQDMTDGQKKQVEVFLNEKLTELKNNYKINKPGREALISKREPAVPDVWDYSGYQPRLVKPGTPEKPPTEIFPAIQSSFEFDPDIRLPFDQADQILTSLQKDVYNRPELSTLRPMVKQINTRLKDTAASFNSPYAKIKQDEAKIFTAFEALESNVTKEKLKQVLIGAEPVGTSADNKSRGLTETINLVADALGEPDLATSIQNNQYQNQFWKAISESGSRGSGGTNLLGGGLGAAASTATFMATKSPEAALLAGVAGGATGMALQTPRIGVPIALAANKASDAIANQVPKIAESAIPGLLGSAAAQGLDYTGSQPNSTPVPPKQDDLIDLLSD